MLNRLLILVLRVNGLLSWMLLLIENMLKLVLGFRFWLMMLFLFSVI